MENIINLLTPGINFPGKQEAEINLPADKPSFVVLHLPISSLFIIVELQSPVSIFQKGTTQFWSDKICGPIFLSVHQAKVTGQQLGINIKTHIFCLVIPNFCNIKKTKK